MQEIRLSKYRVGLALALALVVALVPLNASAQPRSPERTEVSLAAVAAPQLRTPANGAVLPSIGPVTLNWENPASTTQYQIRVTPYKGDGPGLNLIRTAEASFAIDAPVLGQGPYILLPDMGYTWRIRATDKTAFAPEDDPSWRSWS